MNANVYTTLPDPRQMTTEDLFCEADVRDQRHSDDPYDVLRLKEIKHQIGRRQTASSPGFIGDV